MLTLSFRAISGSVSPRLTVYHFSDARSAAGASASRACTCSPVPAGTFSSYCVSLTGVVQRRSSGLSA